MNGKILVTGVAGFIGFHLAKKLLKENYIVYGLDELNSYYDVNLKIERIKILSSQSKNFHFYLTDINDISFKEKFDCIYNLAAYAGVRHSLEDPSCYIRSNINGFQNILEYAKKFSPRVIYASSSSVYGKQTENCLSEDLRTDYPVSHYAATKKANEIMAYSYSTNFNIQTLGFRFFTVYGPYGRPDMAINTFISKILKNEKIDLYGYGKARRDFTYIDDVVNTLVNALNYKEKYDIINIGKGQSASIEDVVKYLEKYLDKKAKKEYKKLPPGDVLHTQACIEKMKKIHTPEITLEEGLEKTVDWFLRYYQK